MTCIDSSIRVAPIVSSSRNLFRSLIRWVDSASSLSSGSFASREMIRVAVSSLMFGVLSLVVKSFRVLLAFRLYSSSRESSLNGLVVGFCLRAFMHLIVRVSARFEFTVIESASKMVGTLRVSLSD